MVFEGVSRSISIAPKFCSKIKHKSSPCIICYSLCPAEAVTIGGPGETIKVDWDKCTGCGICVSQCPAQVFRLRHGGYRKFIDNLSRSITSRGDLVITCSDNPAYSRQTAVVDCAGIFNVVDFIVLYLHGASRITIKYGLCMECPSKNGRQILEQEIKLLEQLKTIFEDLNAILLNKLLKRSIDLIKYSPEQYYQQMIEEYGITLNYIPLKDIASYLGITPQALSRIRKRIF